MKTLPPEHIAEFLELEPLWQLVDGMLVREWSFASFPEAIAFVDRVAILAEELDHHPDIDIRYKKVKLALTTHAASGLTARDTAFAHKVGQLKA